MGPYHAASHHVRCDDALALLHCDLVHAQQAQPLVSELFDVLPRIFSVLEQGIWAKDDVVTDRANELAAEDQL